MNERPNLPEVLSPLGGSSELDSGELRGDELPAGDGDLSVPREDQPEAEAEAGLDDLQASPKTDEIKAWFRAAEGLVMAYWHDPRTAVKYAVAILRLLQEGKTEAELLAIDPTAIPPITETEAGWQ